jgi:hypothetical protein
MVAVNNRFSNINNFVVKFMYLNIKVANQIKYIEKR